MKWIVIVIIAALAIYLLMKFVSKRLREYEKMIEELFEL